MTAEQDPQLQQEHDHTEWLPPESQEKGILGDNPELRTQGDPAPVLDYPAPRSMYYVMPGIYTIGASGAMAIVNASPELQFSVSAYTGICIVGLIYALDRRTK